MRKHILVAEDNEDMAELYCLQLEALGYDVTVVRNGSKVLEVAPLLLPDLVIMDLLMPIMDGLTAVRQMRENPATRNIPILAATAKAMEGDQEKCLAAGCDGYIAKPFTLRDLGLAIAALLKRPTGQPN
ncbi:MAG TPA: response regulator [Candidatus Binatia bacterium]|jgi:two-component system cell cycle response regulator DivK|nr:response regulator [Candidatus Binatia bacterium]